MKRLLASLLALFAVTGRADQPGPGPDFSHVTSRDIAEQLVGKGELVRIHLFPLEFGGEDIPANITWIPAGMSQMYSNILGTLAKLAADGTVNRLTVQPDYNGASFVPCRLKFSATHSEKPGGFEPVLELWKCP